MTGIIILSAGSSSRLGSPKQNLLFKGKTLLQQAIAAAIHSPCSPVIVVVGANSEQIQFHTQGVTVVHNPDWEQGMATSIKTGIAELQKTPAINSVIIMLCDQPYVDTELLNKILQKQTETNKGIIASKYKQTLGVPVLFSRQYFEALLTLQGQEGAKKLLSVYPEDIATVDFELGAVDIDTMDDYKGLVK